jgi:hypothetical protein
MIKSKRDDLMVGAHSHGKVTFGKAAAKPEYSLPQLKPALMQSSL